MGFKFVEKLWERNEICKQQSDTDFYMSLLYTGEAVIKISTLALVAGVSEDLNRARYQQLYRIVRADGIGEWASILYSLTQGATYEYITQDLRPDIQELTQKVNEGDWRHEAIKYLNDALTIVMPEVPAINKKVNFRSWYELFAQFRNKTRGHGVISGTDTTSICPLLAHSLHLVCSNLSIFKREWAYAEKSLSNKPVIIALSGESERLRVALSAPNLNLSDGVYILADDPLYVNLLHTDRDMSDFWLPNGSFCDTSYEAISYATGSRTYPESARYSVPATPLPPSETEGLDALDIQGTIWGNLPEVSADYVSRPRLEAEFEKILLDERHPTITLAGRGGIGKTSLALSSLHQLIERQGFPFEAIIWFSSRDIDLKPGGPKRVRQAIFSENDISEQFQRLVRDPAVQNEKRDDGSRFEKVLQESPLGPTLFIFDNFETVYNPIHLFNWLDTYIRLPNKILITTRSRQFRADYPIEVKGMEPNEAEELIGNTASHLGIASLITTDFRAELLEESDGHPYVIKILLGEVAKARRVSKVKRIVASQEDILDALFERTYLDLSLPAQRVFLTVSGWRSAIAVPALEAVLLRPTNDKIDVQGAVDELRKCSFIDISDSESDDTQFITVPLVAAVFGNRKLSISPWKSSVELDLEQLQIFGAASSSDIRKGMAPRIRWLFSHITNKVLIEKEAVHKYEPVLQYVATRFPDTWLDLAELYRALGVGFSLKAIEALNSYLQSGEHVNTKIAAWNLLADLYGKEGNTLGEVNAIIEACKLPGTSYRDLSEAANRLNRLSHENRIRPDNEASLTLVRQLASLMRERIESADATSCSRLAWIYILLRDEEGEIWAVNKGYELEPENFHIAKMARRLGIGTKKKF